jgi:phosphoribosylanthranilate isomerase
MIFKDTRAAILKNTEVVLEIIEQLANTNVNVKKQAEQVLDIVQYHSNEWANTIKSKKYLVHNQAYLQVLEEYERLAANADADGQNFMEEEEKEGNPNEIQFFDSSDIGNRIWTNNPNLDYY